MASLSAPLGEALRVRAARPGRCGGLVRHAACLRGPGGSLGSIAVVAEPAKAAEIAEELFVSTDTVRDHVKAIFHKVGVTSRGELVAKLFAEHYEPVHFEHAVHAELA